MNQTFDCPHCLSVTVVPEDEYFDGLCGSCDNDVYTLPDTEDEGDVYEVASGLEIVTPTGRWHLHDEEVIKLITGLSTMLHSRLTRPWSAGNDSTILSRGRITAELETESTVRELHRPVGTTSKLAHIADNLTRTWVEQE